jgi:predicted phosphodiesterase
MLGCRDYSLRDVRMKHLIISDIHSNLSALEAVLAAAGEVDQVWCIGDLVGYGPDPRECIARVRELATLTVAGNHDWAVAGKLGLSEFNTDAREAVLWTRTQVVQAELDYLSGLPERESSGDFTIVHGSPRHPVWEYVLTPSVARSNFAYFESRFCLVGHTHLPMIYALETTNGQGRLRSSVPGDGEVLQLAGAPRTIINPGSVGQPRDGISAAAYALLDTEAHTLTFCRQEYPVEQTQRRMMEVGLPPRLAARLNFGW